VQITSAFNTLSRIEMKRWWGWWNTGTGFPER